MLIRNAIFAVTAMSAVMASPATAKVSFPGTGDLLGFQISTIAFAQAGLAPKGDGTLHEEASAEVRSLPDAPVTIGKSVTAQDADSTRSATATATTRASVVFDTEARGTITFSGDLADDVVGADTGFARAYNENHFFYQFSSDEDAFISIRYDLTGPVDRPFLNDIQFGDNTEYSPDTNISFAPGGDDLHGVLTSSVKAGHIYSLQIDRVDNPGHDVPYQQGPGSQRFKNTSVFSFSIGAGAVPEPASWALMIGGVAVAGGSLRARRRMAAIA